MNYVVYLFSQVKQTISIPGMPTSGTTGTKAKTTGPTSPKDDTFCVASYFAKSRGWVAGSPITSKDKAGRVFSLNAIHEQCLLNNEKILLLSPPK